MKSDQTDSVSSKGWSSWSGFSHIPTSPPLRWLQAMEVPRSPTNRPVFIQSLPFFKQCHICHINKISNVLSILNQDSNESKFDIFLKALIVTQCTSFRSGDWGAHCWCFFTLKNINPIGQKEISQMTSSSCAVKCNQIPPFSESQHLCYLSKWFNTFYFLPALSPWGFPSGSGSLQSLGFLACKHYNARNITITPSANHIKLWSDEEQQKSTNSWKVRQGPEESTSRN